jgi:hypothetical protein
MVAQEITDEGDVSNYEASSATSEEQQTFYPLDNQVLTMKCSNYTIGMRMFLMPYRIF